MKKQIFMSAFALVLLIPAFSFKNIDHPQHVNRTATAKQSIVELGDFTRDGITYRVYIDNSTNTITGVMYTYGFGWYDVYSFSNGVYNPSIPNYVAHLIVKRTETTSSFTYTGSTTPPAIYD
ncbi:hypothetical protein [Mucilaginibacter auburnensis]|uniref:Secreted protein n=1 Tax=Mucilaginibacter auburnensis TaxID=1457233 RepID=A0A2H9VNP9_9SPHI|nr:hypothetical protein [Mucilaginibacter auburnensis]PJJ79933.1 hypothetical protein CLV57_3072 [Mucilaginibacter auburnensis]